MTGRVVITGASGFMGRALSARLRDRAVTGLQRADIERGESALARALAGADCVIHLAARAHRGGDDAAFEADVLLARSLARLASQGGVRRFIHMSSIGVLGTATHGTTLGESTPPAPREPYARAKLGAEEAVKHELANAMTDWVILRPPMVYGPAAPGNFARLVRAVRRGMPLPFGSVGNRRHLVGIGNLLDAIEACMAAPAAARQTFLVADAEPVSTRQLIELIAQGLGVQPRLWPVPPRLLAGAARITGRQRMADSLLADLEIDTTHLRRTVGWQPRIPAHEGIVQAAAASRP